MTLRQLFEPPRDADQAANRMAGACIFCLFVGLLIGHFFA